MRCKRVEISNSFLLLITRIALLYVIMGVCRLLFYVYNSELMPVVTWEDLYSILKGAFIFDSASIFYVNILFVFLSLIPFYFRQSDPWQKFLGIIFSVTNGLAILVNVADVFYYPYKLARIAGDDLRYFKEDIFINLLGEYWWSIVFLLIFMILLYIVGFGCIRVKKRRYFILNKPVFYISQSVVMFLAVAMSIIAIRGFNVSKASFPITVSDATLYVKPQYSSLILSNPFSLIRTANHSLRVPSFTSAYDFSSVKSVDSCRYDVRGMNVVLLVLESFGSAHIKSISDGFSPDAPSFTPFLDSLFGEGLLMRNSYQSGGRSLDAMPAIWASIPSFEQGFLTLPQSQSTYYALPAILRDMGYTTSFMHGAVSSSMSFKAFGQMVGVDNFTFREEYGADDFDGKWGVWDHKFLPFVVDRISELKQPFFNTIFTLSSHHPFLIPDGYQGRYPKGSEPISETIAYSDDALRNFFAKSRGEDWFNNTLFIITADHGSGADNEKWRGEPYSHRVPIFFYTPNGIIAREINNKTMSHVDIMPTVLSMMHYEKPFFSFGESIFSEHEGFAVHNSMGAFNVVTDNEFFKITNNEPMGTAIVEQFKGYILKYYKQIKDRKFTI